MTSAPLCRAKRVDIIVYPGFKALEAIGPMSVFEYANVHLARQGRPKGYDVAIAASSAGSVRSDMWMSLEATRTLATDNLADIAIIVGARTIEDALKQNPDVVTWARSVAPRLERLVALCSGCVFLAAAGLLDGSRATTHWSVAAALKSTFPKVEVDPDAIYVRTGNLWTSAGVTASIDLTLAVVEEDFGRPLALEVARDLVVYLKRPGGQSQFSVHLASQSTSHPGIRAAQDWILSHLEERSNVVELARRAAMSERNFRRLFGKEVGMTPAGFLEQARLDGARRLLEDGDLPLKSVASRVGFASEQSLRRLFARHLGVLPEDYRARFGSAT